MPASAEQLGIPEMVSIWEAGRDRHPIDRAVLLAATSTEAASGSDAPTRDVVARWPLGERDRHLLRVRQATFGDALAMHATCPACDATVELELRCSDLLAGIAPPEGDTTFEVTASGYRVRARVLDSTDLAAVAGLADVELAREALIGRCILEVTPPPEATEVSAFSDTPLPDVVVEAIAERLAVADPMAEVLLDLACPECGAGWQAPLDLPAMLWTEVSARARRVLLEVDALARAYGWTESDIFALSPTRRATYLELAVG